MASSVVTRRLQRSVNNEPRTLFDVLQRGEYANIFICIVFFFFLFRILSSIIFDAGENIYYEPYKVLNLLLIVS